MSLADLKARLSRLASLAKKLVGESDFWDHEEALLLSREKKAYESAILDALAGIEQGRVVLAGVIRRMELKRGA